LITVGIDLGTTNSLVAYWTENGPHIIPNSLGSNLTPSVISLDENDNLLVGQIAKERLVTHPDLSVATFKRYMGTEKKYNLGKYTFTPEELSSFVIRSLKEDAEASLNDEVTEAVISVPAYFNDAQRKATKRAGELAGLKVERLISEPTAAAVAYGLHQEKSETRFLVFDLGGGTFDVSILELFEGVMEVKSIAGYNFLGGEDFTNLIINSFIEQSPLKNIELDNKIYSLIYKQAEICKLELSKDNMGKMRLNYSDNIIEKTFSRVDFEKLVNPLMLKLRKPIERALRDADLSPKEMDSVILIGGATRMPVIRSAVSRMFGKLPFSNINPDEAVALGAAIQVALKERNSALEEVVLTDVCPYSLGVDVAENLGDGKYESGYFLPIIERNTSIPVSRVEYLSTIRDNQTVINLGIYQGESRRVENNIKLGELNVKLPSGKAGEHSIEVRYTYDINGILEVEVTVKKTGEKSRIIIEKNPGSMTKKEIEDRLNLLSNLKIHPRDRSENRLLVARGERMYEEATGEMRTYISGIIKQFEMIMAQQDDHKIKKAAKELKEILDELERRFEF
jgi:molecular chaperone HscC